MKKKPNLIFFGIDSIRADHMSLYGYDRLTTPHIEKFARGGAVFENTFSPHIPTTPGYSSCSLEWMFLALTLWRCATRGRWEDHVKTLAEVLGENGYNTTCVGFSGNQASRGFQNYIDFSGWGSWEEGRSHKAENLNAVSIPELKRLAGEDQPFFLFMAHGPALPVSAAAAVRENVLRWK